MTDKPIFNSVKEEPCLRCGEETAIGSVFFSDRREGTTPEGAKYFLCSFCIRRLTPHDHQPDLNDPDFYESLRAAGMSLTFAP
jgi:hypothetical protein